MPPNLQIAGLRADYNYVLNQWERENYYALMLVGLKLNDPSVVGRLES